MKKLNVETSKKNNLYSHPDIHIQVTFSNFHHHDANCQNNETSAADDNHSEWYSKETYKSFFKK